MKKNRVIVWFRNDLRVHDNEALYDASNSSMELYPVYVFDPRLFSSIGRYGFKKTGAFRAKFILESVENLRKSLQHCSSELIVRIGRPEEVIFDLAKELKTSWVFCNRERTDEEVQVQDRLERNLWAVGQEVRYSRGKMLYYTADLPFPVTHTPETFTAFRKEVEKIVEVRKPLPTPEYLPGMSKEVEFGTMPDLAGLGYDSEEIEMSSSSSLQGGEDEGLRRLNNYFWLANGIADYSESRDVLTESGGTSNLSSYLSQGCLSPKTIYTNLKKYEVERSSNDSTYQFYLSLLHRDYYRLLAKKHGNTIFKKGGIVKEKLELANDLSLFRIWAEGRTGFPLVDAAMTQLNTTGFLSHRARQLVASFMIHEMKINWQMGAELFESLLIDYDPCSNWVNWNLAAGLSNDPKECRKHNVLVEAKKYDPKGNYIRSWLPAMDKIGAEYIHQPSLLSDSDQQNLGFILGRDYPNSVLKLNK